MRNRWWAAPVLVAAATIGLAACGTSGGSTSSTPPAAAPAAQTGTSGSTSNSPMATGLKLTTISGHKVLTDAQGFTLYWYAPDTPTKSNCNGQCATFWPPVIGTPTAAAGVKLSGMLGTITRSDGKTQATYMGHPLYTFKSDTAAGQDSGNGLNASGGLWWAMTAAGAKIKATSPSGGSSPSSGGSGGGGYGY
jgi:predicted lipoprotein with Yx(FWY)xxD motif